MANTTDAAKDKKLNKLVDDLKKKLDTEGVDYFIAVIDKRPERTDGGKIFAEANLGEGQVPNILQILCPTKTDLINMGLWLGGLIQRQSGVKSAKLKTVKNEKK